MKLSINIILKSSFILFLSLVILLPFVFMISTSLKTDNELVSSSFIISKIIAWDNYVKAMQRGNWLLYFWNIFYITAISVIVSLAINSIAGYAFARLNFKGRNTLFMISLITMMIPTQVTMIPLFYNSKKISFYGGK